MFHVIWRHFKQMCLKKGFQWMIAEYCMNPSVHPLFSTSPRSGPSSESWVYPKAFAQIAMPGTSKGRRPDQMSEPRQLAPFRRQAAAALLWASPQMSELVVLSLKLSPATLGRNFISLFLYECFDLMKIHISHILKYESHGRQLSRVECETLTSSLHSCLFLTLSFLTFWLPLI